MSIVNRTNDDLLMANYQRLPVNFTHGSGAWLYDGQERAWLDAISGIGVTGLGHAHPAVTKTIKAQAERLLHTSNLYQAEWQQRLADKLISVANCGLQKAFFCNSGAEANEAAFKLARLHGHGKGVERPEILVLENAFHGRTLATMTASSKYYRRSSFSPFVSGFVRTSANDLESLHKIAANNANLVAVFIEPIQGEAGVLPCSEQYLLEIQALCEKHEWLFMLDEVQTGNGRTGRYFCHQHYGLQPDVITTAKGLGNGVPVAACLAGKKAAFLFDPGAHGSTYGGNPLACATACAVVDTIVNEGLCEQAAERGAALLKQLEEQLKDCPWVVAIRGRGLMIGIELKEPPPEPLMQQALDRGVLINVTNQRFVRLLPPLIINKKEGAQIADTVGGLLNALPR